LGEAGWEYKVDGARIQVHKEGEEVRIFTRSLKDITESVPELVTMARGFPLEKGVLEGEAIALREDGRPLPFQVTMRRFGRIQTERLLQLKVNENEWTVYVKPELVVEVAFSDLQESPRYSGGLALRFARVKRYREDKSPQETDTLQKVWAIFESQRR
jgi:ATP-dependent DNA ligase